MYVSITGLKPKSLRAYFRFWILAIPSFNQARAARGNLHCSVKRIQGQQCTLTAWESRELMLDFMRSGAHLKAMKAFRSIATGKTYGYVAETVPQWKEAFALLQKEGREY